MGATAKRVTGELRIVGPGDAPRERFCAQVLQQVLLKLNEKSGRMPVGAVLALQWPGEEATKVFVAADSADSAGLVQMGVYKEIMSALELGENAMKGGAPSDDRTGPRDPDEEDEDEDEEEDDVEAET
jgi:hypothetical protein